MMNNNQYIVSSPTKEKKEKKKKGKVFIPSNSNKNPHSQYLRKKQENVQNPSERRQITYFCNFTNTINDVLKNRGWQAVGENEGWNFVWADREWVYSTYDRLHLDNSQKLNHFRNGRELCRKDLMAKNVKKRKRLLEKESHMNNLQLQASFNNQNNQNYNQNLNNLYMETSASYDFLPTTFTLPKEYTLFVEEFKRNSNSVWIMKPIGAAQGRGIFLFTKLNEISDWKYEYYKNSNDPRSGAKEKDKEKDMSGEAYVVQKYLMNPLLIGGKKFDIRLYTLVTSFSPLKVYQYREGFARFTNTRYNNNKNSIKDSFIHLTNVAVQKTAENYDERTGGKMFLRKLKMVLMAKYGVERVDRLFWEIQMVILRSLLAVQQVMINDRHCFELYGYDILIDENLKPWLIEVNASPSLSANTEEDYNVKCSMLHGMLDIIDMDGVLTGNEDHISGWDLVYDNGYVTVDPNKCGYSCLLGSAVPSSLESPEDEEEYDEEDDEDEEEEDDDDNDDEDYNY